MGQLNLEQIQEETPMESYMAGMESGEYFSQLQLQSPQLQQAPFSLNSPPQQTQHSGHITPMMTPQFDYSNTSISIPTPLLASQPQTPYDISAASNAMVSTMAATPTISSSSTLLPSSMDASSNFGYPHFSTSVNPLFSSPPTLSSTDPFSPTNSNVPGYFAQHQQPSPHYMSGNIIIPQGNAQQSPSNDTHMTQDGNGMYMSNPGMNVWDQFSMSNPTPSVETLMNQQESGFSSTTPPATPQRHPRLFHSQSQPGLRNIHQEQQKLLQNQQQQTLRRRQHSVHFPGEFLSSDLSGMRTNRHVSLPAGSYSAPIPSFASLSEMMHDSPSGASMMGNMTDPAATFAETATLLSMSLPASNHGFSFLDSPPPPLPLHHPHHHFVPTSPPLSSADLSVASTPTTPKSRSRAGSKSRSRPTSTTSSTTVRNAAAPYSPSISNSTTTPSAITNSRSPSLVPLSPIPPFKQGSIPDSELTSPPTPAYETGLIVVPGAATTPNTTVPTTPTSGGKARRISRTKVPGKSRSRSSTITSPTSTLATPESTSVLMSSPYSLVLSEQDEKTLQNLAEQHESRKAPSVTPPGDDIDPFQLDATVQMQQQQYQSSMFEMPLIPGVHDEDGIDGDGIEDIVEDGDETNAGTAGASSQPSSPPSSSGKPVPCPYPSCTKTFTRPFNLTAHVKSHDTAKPYGCHLCSRVFSRKHDLQRHIRVHTGSKPYVCVNCQKAFARTDALCRHYKVEEPCKLFMQQDEVRKQAQQQVQQQLHQEQVELQQAQQAHALAQAKAKAEAEAEAQSSVNAEDMMSTDETLIKSEYST
ncbi:hypothetical protein BGZ76_010957 [Entomortierella beljakovae]|nr:hypothetical protein BGZ76_010957 [Entomortierella beljakovae]